ncbi:MAG: hypothetical protein K2X04_03640 [Burkholderiales bacterium]|nr:hypothetical protein [Burkholderiales bacterium]
MKRLYDAKYFSSRLLGQNRFFSDAGAVIDVVLHGNIEEVSERYVNELSRLLAVLSIKDYAVKMITFSNGFNVAIRYPYDLLMVACEILDWVWYDIVDLIDDDIPIKFERSKRRFKTMIRENQQLLLRKVYTTARQKQVNFFVHKDLLILGSGIHQFRSKLNNITKLADIPWGKIADIPSVLITGTNGKTTTTRLTEFICRKAKLVSGYCSTDWVMVNNKLVAEGDLSGPSGHQFVLMHPKVELAILEVARGGIIKRGLLPNYATAATVTNIFHDHIGQNGIENLADLAAAKAIVYNGLKTDGIAIINLDDEHIRAFPLNNSRKAYLSTKLNAEEIQPFITMNNFVVYLDNQQIVIQTCNEVHRLNNITQIPITVHGLAQYNYENVLHATALTFALGLTPAQIMFGLAKFGADARSNFGRWNYYHSKVAGHLVVDIAHNLAGVRNILDLAQEFRKLHGLNGRLGLMYGNTADRRETIPEVVKIILEHKVDLLVIKEFQESLRGSVLGEMPELFRLELLRQGYPQVQLKVIPNELEATEYILAQAQPEDMYLLCSHELLTDVSKLLREKIIVEKNYIARSR